MQKRITITYTCDHAGKRLPPVVEKFWDSSLPPARVCWCQNDPEKMKPMAIPMTYTVEVVENKSE